MPAVDIAAAAELLDQLSILEEARLAAATDGVHALHDVTEGGLATALAEFAAAGGRGMRIDLERIPVLPSTQQVCGRLGLDPLGLIGSGSLLICVAPEAAEGLVEAIRAAGIAIVEIGEVVEGAGIRAVRNGQPADWPVFAADEITKVLSDEC